jgi:hypothetical protein
MPYIAGPARLGNRHGVGQLRFIDPDKRFAIRHGSSSLR